MAERKPPQGLSVEEVLKQIEERCPVIPLPDPPLHPTLLTLRVDLVDAEPAIWRRIELRGDLTLDAVHDYLQAAFGWQDSHLHQFDAPGVKPGNKLHFLTEFDISEGDVGVAERSARLDQVLPGPGDSLTYIYDFGDNWEHRLAVETARPATDDDPPGRCAGGAGACPPEDVGGIGMWNQLAAALRADPAPMHLKGELERYAEWLPRGLHPDDFFTDEADLRMAILRLGPAELFARIGEATASEVPVPKPGPELVALLGHCHPAIVAQFAQIAARAATFAAEKITADDLKLTLRPWQATLDVIGDEGVKLTPAGWMPPATVTRIWEHSGGVWRTGNRTREENTTEVRILREECSNAGLLRKYNGKLLLTKRGKQCREVQEELVKVVAQSLAGAKDAFDQDSQVATLLCIAANWKIGPDSRWAADAAARDVALTQFHTYLAFQDDVAHLLDDAGWRVDPHAPLGRDDLGRPVARVMQLLSAGRSDGYLVPSSPAIRQIARMALFAAE